MTQDLAVTTLNETSVSGIAPDISLPLDGQRSRESEGLVRGAEQAQHNYESAIRSSDGLQRRYWPCVIFPEKWIITQMPMGLSHRRVVGRQNP